jgi:hypothetical protein
VNHTGAVFVAWWRCDPSPTRLRNVKRTGPWKRSASEFAACCVEISSRIAVHGITFRACKGKSLY